MFAILFISIVCLPVLFVLGACAVEIIATAIAHAKGETWESFEAQFAAHEEADLAACENNFVGFLPTLAMKRVKRHTAAFFAPVVVTPEEKPEEKPEVKPEVKPEEKPEVKATPRFVKSGVFSAPEIWGWATPVATLGEAWDPVAEAAYSFDDEADFVWGFDLGFTKPIDRETVTDHNEVETEVVSCRTAHQLQYKIRRHGDHRRLAETPV